ncbi:MAG: hypothetical protein KAT78_03745 [Flavobacteriaceae bacterium]|nr:hypothetical protein [Flavobacteriaceae bacterium]
MGMFSKEKKATQFFIKDKKLKCNVCENDKFTHRESQLNTRLASLFNLDFANKKAYCYVCDNCSNIQWFLDKI